jgi:cell wall-associated NlpC family hydrolase
LSGADAFVAQARAMLGVKWRHRGRKPWAVDCLGLVFVAGRAAGLETGEDPTKYGREPWEDRLYRGCVERFGEPVPLEQARAGDVALFRLGTTDPSHIGVLGDHPTGGLTLIHAHNLLGVVECSLRGEYLRAVVAVFRTRFR